MAVTTTYAPITYAGNGSTTAFPTTWPFFAASDLVVTLVSSGGVETVKSLTTHYTVSGGMDANGLPATGTVTMLTAPATGETLRLERRTTRTQQATWNESDGFPQKTVEAAFDRAMLIGQEAVYAAENPDQVDVGIAIGTVTTGAAGSSASASIVESPANTFTLDLTIPRGDTGASGAGTGDVVGPGSATDNAVVRFDGSTGKIVQNSAVTIDDTTGRINGAIFPNTGLKVQDTDASHTMAIVPGSNITANRTLTVTTGDADRTVTLSGNLTVSAASTINQDVSTTASPTFATPTVTSVNVGNVDTTVARAAAGEIEVEGNRVWSQNNVGARINALTTTAYDPAADYVPFYDASGAAAGKVLGSDMASSLWVEIGDTTIGGAVANVEHTWTAGTYSQVLVVVSDISGSAGGADVNVTLRHSGGAIITLTYGGASIAAAEITTGQCSFSIGLDAATKHHVGKGEMYSPTAGAASISPTGGSNATAPDRIRVAYSSGNIDDGRIITYGLKV